jgi:hypothetical protein
MTSGAQRRNRITAGLGAVSALAFGGLYALVAGHAASSSTSGSLPQVQAVMTPAPAVVAASASDDSESDDDSSAVVQATPAPATPAPTVAAGSHTTTTHTQTRGS